MYCLTLVVVGDDASKKTQLLTKYTGRDADQERFGGSNVLDEVIMDHTRYLVHFIDAESSDDYSSLRRGAIENANCVILCFSVMSRSSFKSLSEKWCLEIRDCAPYTPIVLAGTEVEKRTSSSQCVTTEEGENFKKLIGAFSFVECSIEAFVGVDDVFIEAIRSVTSRYHFLKPLIKIK